MNHKNQKKDLKQCLLSLQACETLFHNIIEKSADGIVIVDKEGIVHFMNPAAEQLFDRKADELIGQLFGYPIAGSETTEIEIITRNKKMRFAEMRVVQTEWEGEIAYLASIRNITKRKEILRALQESEEKFRKISQTAQDAIIMIDNEEKITYWNEAAEKIFSYRAEETNKKALHTLIAPKKFYEEYLSEVLNPRKTPEARFHPYLTGDRHRIKRKSGAFTRMTLNTDRDDLLLALSHGIISFQNESITEWGR